MNKQTTLTLIKLNNVIKTIIPIATYTLVIILSILITLIIKINL